MKSVQKMIMTMANGTFDTLMSVNLQGIVLPEFVNDRVVDVVQGVRMFDSLTCHYDVIYLFIFVGIF